MRRVIIVELHPTDDREFPDILRAMGTDSLRGCTIHVAVEDAADRVLAALPEDAR
jgi:hypothetical protein